MIKIGTVCSGIGAPEKALRNLGIDYELSYFCEFDKYAVKSYCAIHGENESKNLGDFTKVEIEKLPCDLDLIVGGTPCQDFSIAGKRNGGTMDSGTRSSLMWNFVEIIRQTKPKVVLWENVPGCLTAGQMRSNFNKFYNTLCEIGYRVHAKILNAKNFGVPQNRNRVFLIAIRKDLDISFEMPEGYDCGIRLRHILETEVDEKYFLSDKLLNTFIQHKKNKNSRFIPTSKNEFAKTILAHSGYAPDDNAIIEENILKNNLIELTNGQSQGNRVYDPNGISVTLSANGGGGGAKTGLYQVPQVVSCAIRGRGEKGNIQQKLEIGDENMHALTASFGQKINLVMMQNKKTEFCNELIQTNAVKENDMITHNYTSHKRKNQNYIRGENNMSPILDTRCDCLGVVQQRQIRKLTPVECFRLMGFDDGDIEKCRTVGISDSQLYKQAGNSIVVNVLMAIFGELYHLPYEKKVYGEW